MIEYDYDSYNLKNIELGFKFDADSLSEEFENGSRQLSEKLASIREELPHLNVRQILDIVLAFKRLNEPEAASIAAAMPPVSVIDSGTGDAYPADVLAPGVDILCSPQGQEVACFGVGEAGALVDDGGGYATAKVIGTVALLLAKYPGLLSTDVARCFVILSSD